MIRRRYVEVDGRRVLYRRVGSGPPLVMLHGSPGNGAMLTEEMAAAASSFTCIAFDTPGFGGSDPLFGEAVSVRDLAGATVAAMDVLNLPPCVIYGTHSGAMIAAELAAYWPNRVTGAVLDALPIFADDEIADIFCPDFFTKLVPDALGGHLTATWMRFRDQFTWFPWGARELGRLNPVDRPAPADIDHWVTMFYRAAEKYGPAYRAICHYGAASRCAAEVIITPAVFMASEEDMLYPHLDRLPPLKPNQRIERLRYDPPAKSLAIAALARSLPSGNAVPDIIALDPAGEDPAVQFVDTCGGQVFVRVYGDEASPALILLHDAPGSGLALERQAREFADRFRVIVPDLPGCGESDDPPGTVLNAGAATITIIADALNIDRFIVAATGCGTAVAANITDPRLTQILVENVPIADPETADLIAPDLSLAPEGTHWITAWLMVRDSQIYRPWFDGRVAAQRRAQGNFDAQWLHDQTVEIMKARASYHRLPREAWAFDSNAALAGLRTPVHRGELASLITLQGAAA